MIGEALVLNGRYRLGPALFEDDDMVAYEATDLEHNRAVLVRVIRPERATDQVLLGGLKRRLGRVRKLNHPGLLPVYDAQLAGEHLYVVEPLAAGHSLAQRLADGQHYPWDEARTIGIAAAQGLGAAHRAGLVHGAIDPSAIVMNQDGTVQITDLARPATAVSSLERARFVAPEVLEGHAPSARSDVYSLASVVYLLMTGRAPCEAADTATVINLKRSTEPTALIELRPDLPSDLAAVIDQSLSRDPARRPANGDALAELLSHGPRPIRRVTEERSPWPYILGAALAMLFLGALAWMLFTTPVPTVVGLPESQARQVLIEAGLDPEITGFSATTTLDRRDVVAQTPAAGTRVPKGEEVGLMLAWPGEAVTPSLLGLTELDARSRLAAAGLRPGIVTSTQDATRPMGVVVSQSPAAGQQVDPNTEVAMVVNRGTPPPVVVEPPPPTIIESAPPVVLPAPQPNVNITPAPPPVPETRIVPVPIPVPQPETRIERIPVPVPVPTPPAAETPEAPPAEPAPPTGSTAPETGMSPNERTPDPGAAGAVGSGR